MNPPQPNGYPLTIAGVETGNNALNTSDINQSACGMAVVEVGTERMVDSSGDVRKSE